MRRPRSLAIVVAASIVACALAPNRTPPTAQPMRITDPTQRIWFRGFSVLPPNGSDWFAMPLVPADPPPIHLVARFAKVLDRVDTSDVHTAAAELHIWDVSWRTFTGADDFLQFEKEQEESVADSYADGRHRVLATNTAIDTTFGAQCVKYEFSVENIVTDAPGKSVTLEIRGYRCLHPRWPQYLIDVNYAERYVSGEYAFHLDRSEVAPFLKSLSFTDDRPLFTTDSKR